MLFPLKIINSLNNVMMRKPVDMGENLGGSLIISVKLHVCVCQRER